MREAKALTRFCVLVGAFAARRTDKNQNHRAGPITTFYVSWPRGYKT